MDLSKLQIFVCLIAEGKDATGNHLTKTSYESESGRDMKPFVSLSIFFDFKGDILAFNDYKNFENDDEEDDLSQNDGILHH